MSTRAPPGQLEQSMGAAGGPRTVADRKQQLEGSWPDFGEWMNVLH